MICLNIFRDLEIQTGAEVYGTGGAIRDRLLRKVPNDMDFLVRDVQTKAFEDFLRRRGSLKLVGASFGVYLFKPSGAEESVEIAFPRTEISTGPGHRDFEIVSDPSLSIEEDSRRRDFTLNAMYVPIRAMDNSGGFSASDVIDFHDGKRHIEERKIVAVGLAEDRIQEDPLRMLRAMVLIARTGFYLEDQTFRAVKKLQGLIQEVSAERVRDEFIKIMEASRPSRAFKAMSRTGLLRQVFPELADCVGCGQNPKYHSFPVFEHLIYATDAACSISNRLDVRFGTLCHDLGKAPTRTVRPGGDGPDDVSFHNHEIISTQLTYAFMKRLRFPKDFIESVVHLVRQHQYKYDRAWTDKAVRRFISSMEIREEDLENLDNHPQFLVRQADRMGNSLKAHLPVTQKQRDFQRRIVEVYRASTALSPRDMAVNGHDLLLEFSLTPGRKVGQILKFLFDAVEEDPSLNERGILLEKARKFLEETENGNDDTGNREADRESPGAGVTPQEGTSVN